MSVSLNIAVGDIVQAVPEGNWAGCLVIVTELKPWGIQGFTPIPPHGGQAYIRLPWDRFVLTGGQAQFMPASEPETAEGGK